MKRLLKWVGIGLASLVGLLVVTFAAVYLLSSSRMARKFEAAVVAVQVPRGEKTVAEGERLFVTRGCGDCHGENLAGQIFVDDPAVGRFSGANLTRGKGGVGGRLTDGDLARAIRNGVAPDGRALIFMPSTDFHGMSDADVGTLIAYVRSAPPVDAAPPQRVVGPLARLLYLTGKMPVLVSAELIDQKAPRPEAPPAGPTVAYGRYLAEGCTGCHGDGFSGGQIPGGPPDWPPAMNLTSDTKSGLGQWTYSDFEKTMRTGETRSGSKLRPPMPWPNFARLTDTELHALWEYLHTLPPKPFGNR